MAEASLITTKMLRRKIKRNGYKLRIVEKPWGERYDIMTRTKPPQFLYGALNRKMVWDWFVEPKEHRDDG